MPSGDRARDRLLDAMITVAARYGYGGASVARVIREAGVSRATFYERFDSREDCFLATYRRLAEGVLGGVEGIDGRSPGTVLGDMLAWAARDPAAARVFLLESLAGPATVRAERRAAREKIARIAGDLLSGGRSGRRIELTADALIGGLTGVIAIRAFRGEATGLPSLRDDLLAWVDAYSVDAGTAAASVDWADLGVGLTPEPHLQPPLGAVLDTGPLPRGRGALEPSVVAERQRLRVLAAVARLCRERGYAAISVADLVSTAGVTREAFYEQFRGKQDAFLAAQAFGLEQSVSLTAGRFFSGSSWPERVWSGLRATLSYIAAQRDLVYVDLVESYAAGPAAIRRSFDNRMAFTVFLEEGFRQSAEAEALPRIYAEAIAGAIQGLFRLQADAGAAERMLDLLPEAAHLALAPFLGASAAIDFVREKAAKG
jgi:AcrR family transcriptional regulator